MIDETEQLFTTPLKWARELVRIQWDFGDLGTVTALGKKKKTQPTSPDFIDISRPLCWFTHVHFHYPTDIQHPLWIIPVVHQIKTCSDQSRRLKKSNAGTSGGLQKADPLIFLNLRGICASQVNVGHSHPSMLTHLQWINMPRIKTHMRKS